MPAIKYPLLASAAALVALSGCPRPGSSGGANTTDAGTGRAEVVRADAGAAECVDAWIAEHGLNPWGDPPDTMYPGGSPLFDERTGTRIDRLEYIVRRHPELKARCGLREPASAPVR
ncbi:MAG: hypothetical protein IRZ16_00800 [Myxococcaceae bacterium]|nr:hypothetical protein [Myxococcaceae bacterium]